MIQVNTSHRAWGLLFSHKGMRREAERLLHTVKLLATIDPDTATLLGMWFGFFTRHLHTHHTAEDVDLYPLLARRDSTFQSSIASLDADHHALTDLMTKVEMGFEHLKATTNETDRATLKNALVETLSALQTKLNKHLDYEEDLVVERIDRFFSDADIKRIEMQMQRRTPLRDLSIILPWLLESADLEDRRVMMKKLPWLLRVLIQHIWKKRYLKLTGPLVAFQQR